MHTKTIYLILGLLLTGSLFLSCIPTAAQDEPIKNPDTTIYAGIYVISIGNFEFTKGTYLLDFYLMFSWENQNISPAGFEFMNGRATSKEKIYEAYSNGTSEVWYRVQAALFITPQFHSYPFDSQNIKIILEDSKFNTSTLTYTPLETIIGTDKQFTLAGWKIKSNTINESIHDYPWGEQYSQLIYTIQIERDAGLTAAKLLLPPIIFCIVSGLSFFFKSDKITHRLGLGTSMLISAVMFHLSQTSSLPPLPSLILIDKIMIAVYAFLASSLLATTLIYIDDEYWKDVDYTKIVNRMGGILTIILPFIIFAILYYI
ncbi:MAG: hypothetical protein V1726_07245 [Methanobacteriota archaeon]